MSPRPGRLTKERRAEILASFSHTMIPEKAVGEYGASADFSVTELRSLLADAEALDGLREIVERAFREGNELGAGHGCTAPEGDVPLIVDRILSESEAGAVEGEQTPSGSRVSGGAAVRLGSPAVSDSAVPAPPSPPLSPERLADVLNSYRLRHQTIDGENEGLPLVDALTPGWDKSIRLGREEIVALAEHLFDNLDATEPPAEPPAVGGDRLLTSLAEFEMHARYHIGQEQAKPLPDNGLISVLCDAVRLSRENAQMIRTVPPPAEPTSALREALAKLIRLVREKHGRTKGGFDNHGMYIDGERACPICVAIDALDDDTAALAQPSPSDAAPHTRRWNVEPIDGGLRVCEGDHDRGSGCEWRDYIPADAVQSRIDAALTAPASAEAAVIAAALERVAHLRLMLSGTDRRLSEEMIRDNRDTDQALMDAVDALRAGSAT